MSYGYNAGAPPAGYGQQQYGLHSIGAEWTFDDLPAIDDWPAWNGSTGADDDEPDYRNYASSTENYSPTPPPSQSEGQSHAQSAASMQNENSILRGVNGQQQNPTESFRREGRHTSYYHNHLQTISDTSSPNTASPRSSELSYNAVPISDDEEQQSTADMPPTTRRRTQPRTSLVDLTDSPQQEAGTGASTVPSRPRKRPASSVGESSRIIKRTRPSSAAASPPSPPEELDLTGDNSTESLLQQQQATTIAAQQADGEPTGPVKIGKRTCIICMEHYTNATVTPCGHIYCHECLTQALKAVEKNSERGVGTCPMCRKPVSRKKNQIVPVAFMKRSAFKGKKKASG